MEILRLIWAVIGGFIDYLIGILHDISREYRSISKILAEEKEAEKKRMRVSTARTCTHLLLRHVWLLLAGGVGATEGPVARRADRSEYWGQPEQFCCTSATAPTPENV